MKAEDVPQLDRGIGLAAQKTLEHERRRLLFNSKAARCTTGT